MYEIRKNEAKRGIEISFPVKPSNEVLKFLKENKYRWSYKFQVWCKKFGSKRTYEAGADKAIQFMKDFLDQHEQNFNDQLAIGIEIEKEHTSDPEVAKKIALDHLKENPNYYSDPKPKDWAEKELETEKQLNWAEKALEIESVIDPKSKDYIPDDDIIEKRLLRIGESVISFKGVDIPITSNRSQYDNSMEVQIGRYNSQFGNELMIFDKKTDDIEDSINQIKEKILECYKTFISLIDVKQSKNEKIDQGAKYFSIHDVKKLLTEVLPDWSGKETNAMSGSDYLNFAGHKLRFSDHTRPPTSKWNFIHGENYIDAITGLLIKQEVIAWINGLTSNKLTDSDKEKIGNYFDKMPIPEKEIIQYPKKELREENKKPEKDFIKEHIIVGTVPKLPEYIVKIAGKDYPVNSLQEASERYRNAIEILDIGASETPNALVYQNGKQIGWISYNGKVTEGTPEEWTKDKKILYDSGAGLKTEKPELRKEFLRDEEGLKIYMVDGEAVRKDRIEFVSGGHGYVYDWIPIDEVWIDDNQRSKPDDMEATIKHELFEIKKMRDEGMSYNEAHELANKIEKEVRNNENKADTPETKIALLRQTEFIETGETRIDKDYEPSDSEYNQKKVYVPIYVTLWHYADNTDPDEEEFENIENAINNLKKAGRGEPDKYFSPVKELYLHLKEKWIGTDGNIVEDGKIIRYIEFAESNRENEFVKRFGLDEIIDVNTTFEKREESAEKLENKVYFSIGKDLIKEYESNGIKLNINVQERGKYRTINVGDEQGNEFGSIKLRIADHSYNPRNNDPDAQSGNFISVEIANKNETVGRFHGKFGIQFTGEDKYEDVIEAVNERVKEIIDSWNIKIPAMEKEVRNEPEKIITKGKSPLPEITDKISLNTSDYKNAFELNKAIEKLLESKWTDPHDKWSADQIQFISNYSGYGGLDIEAIKAGSKLDVGSLFEFYTPEKVIEKMWGLAYKYGYKEGPVIEPSISVGLFFKREYVKSSVIKSGYEINKYSARICKLLYPEVNVNDGKESMYFEQLFIKNNYTVRGNVKPVCELVIGNPPYGAVGGTYMGMGEESYSKAKNYIDYFIFRGLDLLVPNGLLIYIIGAEVAVGGVPWLDQGNSKCKEMISQKAKLIDAYRLPEGLFARTNVVSDIVVLKKR